MPGVLIPGVPGVQAFYAWGGGGQFAVVVPSLDLVVVTLYGGIVRQLRHHLGQFKFNFSRISQPRPIHDSSMRRVACST